ncbi:hypothetical protein PIB30_087573 [Stylosanthes scabra]|uniref:Uncharacterized protein n=1 Tax=Stylosanthes scabra TaxID=79078 RepID=A0ABU6YSH1_9FABA|nr:hypothetical protein [Stylosanthes scabra]
MFRRPLGKRYSFFLKLLRKSVLPEALRDYDPIESVRWAEWAMLRSENNEAKLEALGKEKDEEIEQLKHREAELVLEVERFRGLDAEEKVRADLAEVSVSELQR